MQDGRELKKINTQIKVIKNEINDFKNSISNSNRDISNFQKEINYRNELLNDLTLKLNKLTNSKKKKLILSEHAILRFLERIKRIDLEKIEKDLISEEDLKLVEKLGGSLEIKKPEYTLVIKDYVIVTIT